MLEARALHKHFGGLTATANVSLGMRQGELHALIGPNGAGKTTLIAQLSGTIMPDAGHILFSGRDITRLSMHRRVALGLVRSYQITSIFLGLSVLDNVALAAQARAGRSFAAWRPIAADGALYQDCRAVLDEVRLFARATTIAGRLSHGEQRRLEIGLSLATQPSLLLLDEPMAGLDSGESERMIELIGGLKRRLTLLLVEHDMDAVFRLADRISVLVGGRLVATGTPEEIRCNAQVQEAYLGDTGTPV
jgi:branched-chain amino acid transport system ATP-binding protein